MAYSMAMPYRNSANIMKLAEIYSIINYLNGMVAINITAIVGCICVLAMWR